MPEHIPIKELERVIKIAARVVVLHGEVYLPLFNRLHKELVKEKEKQETESLAFKLAKSYADLEENK